MGRKTFTPQEVADATDTALVTIYRHLRNEKLPAHKVAGRWVITRSGLREWLGDELVEIYFGDASA
jgi:excisionase family DNA binding protein